MTSLGLELIVKENSQLNYQSVAQLFPQLLVLERGQEQPKSFLTINHDNHPPTLAFMTALDPKGSGKVQDRRERLSFEYTSPQSSPALSHST